MATDWEKEIRELGSREHIEAVGALALFYNRMEFALYSHFQHYLPIDAETRVLLFSTRNNRERVDLLRSFGRSETRPGLADAIDYALQCYDICVENRNLVLHALPGMDEPPANILSVLKASKKEPNVLKRYHFTLEVIRDAALAMETTTDFLDRLFMFITYYESDGQRPVTSLPDKPPKPRTLSLSQLVEDRP